MLTENQIEMNLSISAYEDDSEPIFPGTTFPIDLTLIGEFNSPDYFSVKGNVDVDAGNKVVANFERIK